MRLVKNWWLLVSILAIALVIGWGEKRCQSRSDECRAKYAVQAQLERPSGTVSVLQQATEQQAIAGACESDAYFCRFFSAANLPNILLVFVGICGIIAAFRTLKIVERQTKANEDSVQAVINSERGVLRVELLPVCRLVKNHGWQRPIGTGWVDLVAEEILEGEHMKHSLILTNLGRTAVTVDEVRLQNEFLKDDHSNLHNTDVDAHHVIGYDFAVAGNATLNAFDVGLEDYRRELICETGDSNKTVLFYGFISYLHVFSQTEKQQAWFRYLYYPNATVPGLVPVSIKEKEWEEQEKQRSLNRLTSRKTTDQSNILRKP